MKSGWNDRENLVISVSRIAPGKQLELIPYIASRVKDVRFVLIGSLYNRSYYTKLSKLKKKLGVRNFKVIPDPHRHELYEMLGKARIYLYTARHEQFGMTVVEGMAAGCIPLVYRSGGPYHDIVGEDNR